MVPSSITIATPLDGGLRITGFVEFGGLDLPQTPKRLENLKRHLGELFPDSEFPVLTEWMGFRPTLPDYLPAIDAVLSLDERRRSLLQTVEQQKAERNRASEEVARRKREGEDAAELIADLKTLSESIRALDQDVREVDNDRRVIARRFTFASVAVDHGPFGTGEHAGRSQHQIDAQTTALMEIAVSVVPP